MCGVWKVSVKDWQHGPGSAHCRLLRRAACASVNGSNQDNLYAGLLIQGMPSLPACMQQTARRKAQKGPRTDLPGLQPPGSMALPPRPRRDCRGPGQDSRRSKGSRSLWRLRSVHVN